MNAIRDGLARVVRRFPLVVLCAATGTTFAILSIQGEDWVYGNVLMACGLGLPVLFGLRILRENGFPGAQWIEAGGVLLLAAYACSIPADPSHAPWMLIMRYWVLFIGAHLAVAFVPCLSGTSESEYWEYNRRICVRFILATVYAAVLYGGLSAALGSVSKLFALDVDSKRYLQLWVVMAGLFQPLFFLGGVGDQDEWRAPQQPFKALQAFARFALAPLVVVYLAILYIYLIKLIAVARWPHGWLAMPVSVLAVTGYLAALFIQQARGRADERWANWYWRNFFRAIAPLSILLILAIWKRASEYGVTEWRYLGSVLGVWLLVTSTCYSFRPAASTRAIPASLALLCLAVSWGPWDAFAVSRSSQFQRLREVLGPSSFKDGLLVAGSAPTNGRAHDAARSILSHMIGAYGASSLEGILPKDLAAKVGAAGGRNRSYEQANDILNFLSGSEDNANSKGIGPGFFTVECDLGNGIPVSGFRNLYNFSFPPERGATRDAGGLRLAFAKGEISFETQGRRLDDSDYRAMLDSVWAQALMAKKKLQPAQMSVVVRDGQRQWKIVVTRIQFWRDAPAGKVAAKARPYSISLYILEQ